MAFSGLPAPVTLMAATRELRSAAALALAGALDGLGISDCVILVDFRFEFLINSKGRRRILDLHCIFTPTSTSAAFHSRKIGRFLSFLKRPRHFY